MRNKVFTSGEVANICGVSADTVSRWFDLGQITGYRLGPGGDRRIPYESLKQFMMSQGIPLDRFEEGDRRILVVDDDPYYQDMIRAALSSDREYVVTVASTGFDAGASVVRDDPNLVILDIHLSDMDGRMVCSRIKERAETKNTRILAVSGFLDEEDVGQLLDYGFDGFLRKPFSISELTEHVASLFDLPNTKVARPRKLARFS